MPGEGLDGDFDFEGVFDADYLHFYAGRLDEARSDADADLIVRMAGIEAGERVLDVPCGHGRIANRLAARDIEVVGIDASERFIDLAQRSALERGVQVEYCHGDMRALEAAAEYDVVLNWFTSFGYFDDGTDRAILAAFRRALRPGGRLVLETINRDRLLVMRGGQPGPLTHVVEVGDDMLVDRVELDAAGSRSETERIIVRDGIVRRTHFTVRLFTLTELTGWLRDAGFSAVEAVDGSRVPFTWRSDRLLVVADA